MHPSLSIVSGAVSNDELEGFNAALQAMWHINIIVLPYIQPVCLLLVIHGLLSDKSLPFSQSKLA